MKLSERYSKFRLKVIQHKNKLIGHYLTDKGMRYYKYLTNILADENYEPQNYEEVLFEESLSRSNVKYGGKVVEKRQERAIIIACKLAEMYPPKQFWNNPDLIKCVGI